MNSFIVIAAFLIMLLAPCLVAQCSSLPSLRLRIRKNGEAGEPIAKPKGPALRLPVQRPVAPGASSVHAVALHGARRNVGTLLRHTVPAPNAIITEPTRRASRAA